MKANYIVQQLSSNLFRVHPGNAEFFDDIEEPLWSEFVENVRQHGVINPITVDQQGTIICGNQRWRGAMQL